MGFVLGIIRRQNRDRPLKRLTIDDMRINNDVVTVFSVIIWCVHSYRTAG